MKEATNRIDGERFDFGKNWLKYLDSIDSDRIDEAQRSLKQLLHVDHLDHLTFLDVGSGSGLSSLAARKLGASVHSFDYDPDSVAATAELKRRFYPDDPNWTAERGSILDWEYLERLGTFDVVYSWGVLHHTGAMWEACRNIAALVAEGGILAIAIYNAQPVMSSIWRRVKRTYNHCPGFLKALMNVGYYAYLTSVLFVFDCLRGRNPVDRHRGKGRRGMSMYRDVADWLGGYPFEVATPHEMFAFYRDLGFELIELKTVGGKSGCNEFVFKKRSDARRRGATGPNA